MYGQGMFYPNATENASIKYTHDSIIGNDTVKVLKMHRFYIACSASSTVPVTLIRQRGDTVFMKNSRTLNDWQILFNYSAQKGEAWTTSYYAQNKVYTYSITVDSVSTASENNFQLRRLFVTINVHSGSQTLFNHTTSITERYGWGYLFHYYGNHSGCDGDFFIQTLCYSDAAFGTKYFGGLPCDHTNPLGAQEIDRGNEPQIISPAGKDQLIIMNASPGSYLSVFDITGRKVCSAFLRAPDGNNIHQVSIAGLGHGVYSVVLGERSGRWMCKKIVRTGD